MILQGKSDIFQCKLDDCHGDPKAFWKLMKKVLPSKNRTTNIDKLVVDGVDIVDPKDISDSLNLHFTSFATNVLSTRSPTTTASTSNLDFHHDPPSQLPSSLESSSPTKFLFRPTTDVEISNMLANLNPNKATGNDNIPAKILKISSNCIYQSLSCIVNSSLETGVFPNRWKIDKISSSVFKGNIATNLDNYRPISIRPRTWKTVCSKCRSLHSICCS